MSQERFNELREEASKRTLSQEENDELLKLYLQLNAPEEETAGFFEAIKKTGQNLFSSGAAGIEAIGQASGDLDFFDIEGKGRRAQQLVQPALQSGKRLKTFDDISDVGDAADWLFNSAFPQVATSIAVTLPTIYGGAKAGAAVGSVVPGVGTALGGLVGGIAGAFLPSMLLGTGEVAKEIKARGGDAPGTAIGGGIAMGALDTVSMAVGLRGIAPKLFKNTALFRNNIDRLVNEAVKRGAPPTKFKTALSHALQGAIAEGSIEVSQEVLNDWIAENETDIASPEGELSGRLFETFTLGGVGGAGFGTIGGISQAKNVQQNFDALKEVESIEKAAEQKANQYIADEKIDDMPQQQFTTHLLKNNITDPEILSLLSKGDLEAARKLYKEIYITQTKANELARYAKDGLPEATLGRKTEERFNEIRQANSNQQINDMYDALKRDVLAKGLAQGQSTYNIPVPPDDVDIEAKIYALARKDVMNQYIELSDIGIADENRLLSSPALFEQFKREGREKDIQQLLAEHRELYPTGVGADDIVQEQNRKKMSKDDLIKQIAAKRYKLVNTFENENLGTEEIFDAPDNREALQNIWINEIGRSRERVVDPLSGKVTSFTVLYRRSENDKNPISLTFDKRVDTTTNSDGETIPTNVDYVLSGTDFGIQNKENYIGKTFDEVMNELGMSRRDGIEYRLDPKRTDDFYGPSLELSSYTGKVNENITYKNNPIGYVTKFMNYLFSPKGARKSEAFFELERSKIGRLRAINHRMVQLAHAYDTAVVDEVISTDKTYQEINEIATDFLTNTQKKMFIPKEYQAELIEQLRAIPDTTTFTAEQRSEVIKKIRSGSGEIVGPKVNILDLPENIRAPLVAMRTNIDTLTKRVKDEIPKSILAQELTVQEIVPSLSGEPKLQETTMTIDEIMSKRLGSYVTDQYKVFDTGYNPFGVWEKWWGTKKTKNVKSRAVKALLRNAKIRSAIKAEAKKLGITVEEAALKRLERLIEGGFDKSNMGAYDIGNFVVQEAKKEGVASPIGKLLESKGSQMIPEVRELFGLYDNPAQLAAMTVGKLSNLVENYRFFNRLLETDAISGEKLFSPVKSATFNTKVPLMNTPLDGFYTTKEMADALNTAPKETSTVMDIYRSFVLFPKALAQAGKTVFSPMAQMRNAATASMFYMANGHYIGMFGEERGDAWEIIMSELGAKGVTKNGRITFDGKQAQKVYARLQELGVVNTNTVIGELLGNLEDSIRLGANTSNASEFLYFVADKIKEKNPQSLSLGNARGNILFKGPQRMYQAADDFWKVLTYIAEKRKLEDTWSRGELTELANFAKEFKGYKTGSNKYEDIIEHIAAYNVRHTIPNYDYIGRAGNFIRQTPFGNFIAFPLEILRTSLNIVTMGGREMYAGKKYNKPELYKRGAARILSYSTMMYGIPVSAASLAMSMAENDTSDEDGISEEQMIELRRLIPEYAKYNHIAPISLKDGKFTYFDLSHLMVYDMVAQMGDAVLNTMPQNGKVPEDAAERLTEQFFTLFQPFGEPSIYTQALADVMNNQKNTFRNNRGGDITKEVEFGERFSDYYDYFWKLVQPGIWAQTRDLANALPESEISFSKYGRKKDFGDALAALSGLKISETDVRTTLPFKISDYQKRARNAKNILNGVYQSGAVDSEQLKQEYIRANKALFEAQKDLFLDFRAAMNAGVPRSFVDQQNKDRTIFGTKTKKIKNNFIFSMGLNQLPAEYERFMAGRFIPFRVSEASIETFRNNTREMARTGNLTGVRDINWSRFDSYYNDLSTRGYSLLGDWDSQSEELTDSFLAE